MTKTHQIKEFENIEKSEVETAFFDALREFASYEENYNILKPAEGGNALRAQHYVGTIVTKSGYSLEIFPKIDVAGGDDDFSTAKDVLFKMLQSLDKNPFKQYNNATVDIKKSSILEIYISLFLEDLDLVVKRGIKHDYLSIEGNFPFMKGKLNIAKQLQHNYAHKELFYIQFDERAGNISENKLIKSTLLFLNQITKSFQNKSLIARYLDIFDHIEPSRNKEKDFDNCHFNRTNEYYKKVIRWCEIFLSKHNPHIYSGKKIAYALLYDMQYLFEAYVTRYCKKNFHNVTAQPVWRYLIEQPNRDYSLRPDIVVCDKEKRIILDAKWKDYAKNGISSGDLYQLYTYGKKYNASDVCLIYPKSLKFTKAKQEALIYENDLNLHILCFDCVKGNHGYLDDKNLLDKFKVLESSPYLMKERISSRL